VPQWNSSSRLPCLADIIQQPTSHDDVANTRLVTLMGSVGRCTRASYLPWLAPLRRFYTVGCAIKMARQLPLEGCDNIYMKLGPPLDPEPEKEGYGHPGTFGVFQRKGR